MRAGSIAVFGSCNEAYAPFLATSLRSFMGRDRDSRLHYYVLGRGFSRPTQELLDGAGIQYLPLDLARTFPRGRGRPYPSECFWIFKAPELFSERGYEFSLAVDGDVWCNRVLDLGWLPDIEHLAGIDRGTSVRGFLGRIGQYSALRRVFSMSSKGVERRATNSGVLFFRNRPLAELGFFDRVADIFQRSEARRIPRLGDDSTLALVLAVHPEIDLRLVDESWNAYRGLDRVFDRRDPRYHAHLAEWRNSARIVHLSYTKPWRSVSRYPNGITEHFAKRWQELHRQTDPALSRRAQRGGSRGVVPRRNRELLRRFDVCCYWYRGSRPNYGDELAPYLVKKVAQLPDSFRLPAPPKHPRQKRVAVLLSVGSVMRLSHHNTVCWGAGIRNIDQPVARSARFCAVRGPLTQRRLLALGYECPRIYGDPGLLLPEFYRPQVTKRYRLGIIAHAVDYRELKSLFATEPEATVIDLATTDIESVVAQILACEATVSSALHGLVTSVAYGIPTRWLEYSDRIMGDGTKFFDFYASLEPRLLDHIDRRTVTLRATGPSFEAYQPVRWTRRHSLGDLVERTNRLPLLNRLDELLEACPIGPGGWKHRRWRTPQVAKRSSARRAHACT